ncbi:MAG: insulinase family protein [Verrucomicrobiae bacterium]|nr:insulinase family protein [Verrucomicrobiae bacterium]
MYRVSTLPNGLRVATAEMHGMESVSVGIWIGVGSRYESGRYNGVSHFIEHLLFKGTRRRSAKQISQSIEGIGGYLNAFTSEEHTCYYARAAHQHFDTLVDVLVDMYLHPRFAADDIAKERDVIREELLMYRDQPDHHVQELLSETLWPDQPLGRPLTGSLASLERINRGIICRYKAAHYVCSRTVVAVAGHCRHEVVLRAVAQMFRGAPAGLRRRFAPARENQRAPRLRWFTKKVEQTHLALGVRSFSRHDRRRYAARLLSVILGENMSSRLFQVVRERHGLAYSIHSVPTYFADTGVFVVSAGLDTERLPGALRLILREMSKIAEQPPSARELQRAKDYAIGQMRLGLESTTNQMMWVGEQLTAYGFIMTPEEVERQLVAVTARDVQQVAAALFRNRALNAAIITPREDEAVVHRQLRFAEA